MKFTDLEFEGHLCIVKFKNGYSASIIDDGYGSHDGLYEVGVLDGDGYLTYTTPITDDVIGWLTPVGVMEVLAQIEALEVQSS